MWPNDLWAIPFNLVYFGLALWLADEIRRHVRPAARVSGSLPRLFLAAFIVPSLSFFSHWQVAILVPAALAIALYLALSRAGRRLGPATPHPARAMLWFLAAYVLLVAVFWRPELRYVAAAGMLGGTALMLGGEVGDAFWGHTPYRLFGRKATLEGDLTALVSGAAGLFLSLVCLSDLTFVQALLLGALATLAGGLVRLVAPGSSGHLLVPVVTALSLFGLSRGGVDALLLTRLLWGVIFSGAIAVAGLRWRALTREGAAAAVGVGTAVLAFGGWGWAVPLVVFFVTSSLLTHFKAARKEAAKLMGSKEGPRDASQVLANGLVAAFAAALTLFFPHQAVLIFLVFLGAVAEAAADTWATELGMLSKAQPRLITTGRRCPAGTSGGVTAAGLLAAAAGALVIGATGAVLTWPATWAKALIPAAGGLVGALCDSLLGATLQASYYCPACHVPTESRTHRCGAKTVPRKGLPWLDNDAVNLAGTLAGALGSLGLALWLRI
ncbi:MAG: DUF92 domain-containing protein [Chitinophagales bacterium]